MRFLRTNTASARTAQTDFPETVLPLRKPLFFVKEICNYKKERSAVLHKIKKPAIIRRCSAHRTEKRRLFIILQFLSYRRSFIAAIKSQEFRTFFAAGLAIRAISPVIMPASIVSSVAFSRRFAKSTSSGVPSSSPRFARAPVQAKISATGLVEVFSPF